MKHRLSTEDWQFRCAFEAGQHDGLLEHSDHLKLAYIYLAEFNLSEATRRIRSAIRNFLRHRAVDPSKYHETITRAWMMAVRHFMEISPPSDSSDVFLRQNPRILDAKIMMTHYSTALLSSEHARASFVEPDLDPIPTYDTDGD